MTRRKSASYPIPISSDGKFTVYRGDAMLLSDDKRLCSVLEELAGGHPRDRGLFHGMPWYTPILGSGCLDLGDGSVVDIGAIARITRETLEADGIVLPRELGDPGSLALGFAESLQQSRTHGAVRPSERSPEDPQPAAARLTLLTALLTRLFHGAAMSGPSPTSRWWVHEQARVVGSSPTDVHLRDIVLPACLTLLNSVAKNLSGHTTFTTEVTLKSLLDKIAVDLTADTPVVCIEDLRLITEVAWLELIRDTSIYPGWSDLLLQLLMADSNTGSRPPAGHHPRVVALSNLGRNVARLLQQATVRSWDSRSDGRRPTERDLFYSAIARLLHAQADLFRLIHVPDDTDYDEDELDPDADEQRRRRADRARAVHETILADTANKRPWSQIAPASVTVPHAVAFVTSFDVELEMALWAAGRPYRVVVPVLAKSSRGVGAADLVWLSTTVVPSETASESAIDEMLKSGPHDWRIAQEVFLPGVGGEHPAVIRLSGCPLMALPDVAGEPLRTDFTRLGFTDKERISLHHALIIDEYTSLRHSEHELFFAASPGEDRGLPQCLSGGTRSNGRVWLGLGVQIHDPAIRARIFSLLSTASLIDRTDQHAKMQEQAGDDINNDAPHVVRGLAVNQRIDEEEATALHWLGFQFAIQISSGSLTHDLKHCADHVAAVVRQATALAPEDPGPSDGRGPTDANWCRAEDWSCAMWTPPGVTDR